ncbi:hypothetical protein KAS79_03455 [Candidatus Parcubacteria bacterium]|nr:hypothetical protein [Candidatus Parcubacteria bacterium]
MTKKFRTILFLFFAGLFFLIAPLLILYSQGYRFDIDEKKIVQTGGFFLKVRPTGVEIYIDSKLQKKTNFLFQSVLIQNLIPKKYRIEVKKQGYFSWEKTLETKEKQVTEAKNIILIPKNPNFEILNKTTENFWFLPAQKNIILKELDENGWSLKLFNTEKEIKSYLISEQDISTKPVELFTLEFSLDSKKILLKTGLKEQLKYFIIDLTKTPARNASPARQPDGSHGGGHSDAGGPINLISLDFLGKNAEQISFNSKDSSKIFFLRNNQFFEGNFIDKKTSLALFKNVLTYYVSSENIYVLEKTGLVFETDFSFNLKKKLNQTPFSLKAETGYKLEAFNNFVFLKEAKNTYLLNLKSKSFEKLSETTVPLSISPDSKKIAYLNNNEIWVLFLTNISDQPKRKANDKIFLTRFSEKIKHISWLSSDYLIFACDSKIKIVEIDDRDKINIIDLAPHTKLGEGLKIFFNQNNKKLYILTQDNLYSSEKLLP